MTPMNRQQMQYAYWQEARRQQMYKSVGNLIYKKAGYADLNPELQHPFLLNGKGYDSLKLALQDASSSAVTTNKLAVLRDVNLDVTEEDSTSGVPTLPSIAKNMEIDLCGHTVESFHVFSTGNRIFRVDGDADLTVKNGTFICHWLSGQWIGPIGPVRMSSTGNMTVINVVSRFGTAASDWNASQFSQWKCETGKSFFKNLKCYSINKTGCVESQGADVTIEDSELAVQDGDASNIGSTCAVCCYDGTMKVKNSTLIDVNGYCAVGTFSSGGSAEFEECEIRYIVDPMKVPASSKLGNLVLLQNSTSMTPIDFKFKNCTMSFNRNSLSKAIDMQSSSAPSFIEMSNVKLDGLDVTHSGAKDAESKITIESGDFDVDPTAIEKVVLADGSTSVPIGSRWIVTHS